MRLMLPLAEDPLLRWDDCRLMATVRMPYRLLRLLSFESLRSRWSPSFCEAGDAAASSATSGVVDEDDDKEKEVRVLGGEAEGIVERLDSRR